MANGVITDFESQLDPTTQYLLALQRLQRSLETLSGSTGAAADIQEQPFLERLRGGVGDVGRGLGGVLSNLVQNPPAPVPGISLEEMSARYPARDVPSLGTGELIGGTLGSIINALNREKTARIGRSEEAIGTLQRQTIQDVAAGKYGNLTSPQVLERLNIILTRKPTAEPLRAETSIQRALIQERSRQTATQALLGGRQLHDVVTALPAGSRPLALQTYNAYLKANEQGNLEEAGRQYEAFQQIAKEGEERAIATKQSQELLREKSRDLRSARAQIQRTARSFNVPLTGEEANAAAHGNLGFKGEDVYPNDPEQATKFDSLIESAQGKLEGAAETQRKVVEKRLEDLDSEITTRAERVKIDRARLALSGLRFESDRDWREFNLFYQARLKENMQKVAQRFRIELEEQRGASYLESIEKMKRTKVEEGAGGIFGAILGLFGLRGTGVTPPAEGEEKGPSSADMWDALQQETLRQATEEYRAFKQASPGVDINEVLKGAGIRPTAPRPVPAPVAPAPMTPKAEPGPRKPGVQRETPEDIERRIRRELGL